MDIKHLKAGGEACIFRLNYAGKDEVVVKVPNFDKVNNYDSLFDET